VGRVLIIGYGNPLRSDDGFGWHAAEELSSSLGAAVEVLARQQLTPDLAETASHYPMVIFVDASREGSPGTVRCERVDGEGKGGQASVPGFSHFLTPASLLNLTAELYGVVPEAYFLTVGGECFEEGESVTPRVQAAFQPVLARIQSLISQHQ
jgi:hydrogenase maturation protease